VDFRILGALEVEDRGESLPLGGHQQRALLALLLLRANEVVPLDEIIGDLWGAEPPPSATKSVHALISKLRRTLENEPAGPGVEGRENGVLVTHPHGYVLTVAPGELDLHRFQSLFDEGQQALSAGRTDDAATKLRQGLALWRGPPLAEFAYESFAQIEIARLEELRLSAFEERIDADLALGRDRDLIPELEALVAKNPLRERLRGQLMLALYRSGRQAHALDAYQGARRTLVEELGIEPGPELHRLEGQILNHDPALDRPLPAGRRRLVGRARRSRVALLLLTACAVAGAMAGILVFAPDGGSPLVPADAVGVLKAKTGKLVAHVAVGSRPTLIAYDRSARHRWLWVANADDQTLSRIDPTTRKPNGPVVSLGATPAGLAVGFDSVWVLDRDVPRLLRVDPDIGRVLKKIPLPLAAGYFPAGLTVGDGSVWAAYDSPGQLVRVDPATGRVVKRIVIGSPTVIAFGAEAVWIGGPYDGVTRIDPRTNSVRHREPLPNTVTAIAVGNGYVWATVGADDVIWQLDTDGNIQRSFGTGSGPAGVTVSGDAVWVANSRDGTVTSIDPSKPNAPTTTRVGHRPAAIVAVPVATGAELWLTVAERPAEPLLPPNGAGIVMGSDAPSSISPAIASVDPAIAFSPQAYQWEYATAAKLFNYPDEPPPAGLRPQPELAAASPAVSDGGTTYTFRMRSGFRFSPPSNELVTAATVRDSIERALSPELGPNAPGIRFADVIEGVNAYHAGTAAHVAGLHASGDTLTIRLTRPVGDLLHRLALPMFSVVPRGTAVIANGLAKPIPSAGPYYVASYTPGEQLVLRRNPHYTGPRPHALDEFVYTFGESADQAAGLVKAGQADYTTPGLPPAFPILSPAFAPGGVLDRMYGPHGVSKPQRFFLTPTLSIGRLAMNTSRGIFRDARLRRAVSYALDRSALAAQLGPLLGGPSDEYLPLGMPGSRHTHLYPLTLPNLVRAKALARGRGGRAMLWTCNLPGCLARAEIIRRSLAPLGIQVTVKSDFPVGGAVVATSKRGANFDLFPFMSIADLPDPGSFLRSLFDGSLLRATGNTNVSYFDNAVVNARLARADRLSGRERERTFGRIAADLARNQAPIAVFSQPYEAEFVSKRLRCLTEQPAFGGLDLAALCLRR
jgi:DNA-binding SARP family transcriptional activator/ABC-type transport system substrate-binding protein/DNA-binding beta-propeller fold protein YncE